MVVLPFARALALDRLGVVGEVACAIGGGMVWIGKGGVNEGRARCGVGDGGTRFAKDTEGEGILGVAGLTPVRSGTTRFVRGAIGPDA